MIVVLAGLIWISQVPGTNAVGVDELVATVVDADGNLVTGLGADAFQLDYDGRVAEIIDVLEESELPLSIGLLIDTSSSLNMSTLGVPVSRAATAVARILVDTLVRPEDEVMIMSFSDGLEVESTFTGSADDIDDALIGLHRGENNYLMESLDEALREINAARYIDRLMIIITDKMFQRELQGADERSLDEAREELRRAETPVYTVVLDPEVGRANAAVEADEGFALALERSRSKMVRIHSDNAIEDIMDFATEIEKGTRGGYTVSFHGEGRVSSGAALRPVRLRTIDPAYRVSILQMLNQ